MIIKYSNTSRVPILKFKTRLLSLLSSGALTWSCYEYKLWSANEKGKLTSSAITTRNPIELFMFHERVNTDDFYSRNVRDSHSVFGGCSGGKWYEEDFGASYRLRNLVVKRRNSLHKQFSQRFLFTLRYRCIDYSWIQNKLYTIDGCVRVLLRIIRTTEWRTFPIAYRSTNNSTRYNSHW